MSTLEQAAAFLRALKRYRDSMTPKERAAYDKRIKEDPMGLKAMFRPTPLFETLKSQAASAWPPKKKEKKG